MNRKQLQHELRQLIFILVVGALIITAVISHNPHAAPMWVTVLFCMAYGAASIKVVSDEMEKIKQCEDDE